MNFAAVPAVFDDDSALTIADEHPDEDRYIAIGRDTLGRMLAVVYTIRSDRIRLISARLATGRERAEYEGKR